MVIPTLIRTKCLIVNQVGLLPTMDSMHSSRTRWEPVRLTQVVQIGVTQLVPDMHDGVSITCEIESPI